MRVLSALCVSILGAGLLAEAAPALKGDGTGNLVANGSFEDGPAVPAEGYKPLDKGATDLKGWVVTRGQIDAVRETGGLWKAADGKRCLDLHGSPGLGGVKQTVATRAGRKYRVTFQMSGNPGGGHTKVSLTVRAAGADKEFAIDMAGRTLDDLKWEKRTWEFTAAGAATELEIHTAMPPTSNPFAGPLLDDVRVVAID
jgi:choice-of-anchor C domain-containing protein